MSWLADSRWSFFSLLRHLISLPTIFLFTPFKNTSISLSFDDFSGWTTPELKLDELLLEVLSLGVLSLGVLSISD